MKPKLLIDAGHNFSSFNTGAAANGLQEHEITFDVSQQLAQLLANDFDIRLTRPTLQTNLGRDNASAINARWQMANEWRADAFISIHTNAGGGTGAETFFFRDNTERSRRSESFARNVNDIYAADMGLRNRGVKPDTQTAVGAIGVLRHTQMPAVLVELAFIDSPPPNPDVEILRNRRAEMASALARGIRQHFGVTTTTPAAPVPPKTTVRFDILGTVSDVDGYITDDGVTWVRARQIIEALGYNVGWNVEEQAVEVRK